jgi:DNA-binding MarR family transcriptional regulator
MSETNDNARRLLQLLERLRPQLIGRAIRHFHALQLSHSHARVLGALCHTGPLAMKEVANELGLTPPSVTAITRHLVQTGLVARRAHAADSRVTLLELTEAGHELHRQLHGEHMRGMEQLLGALSAEEQRTFLDLLERAVNAGDCDKESPCKQN